MASNKNDLNASSSSSLDDLVIQSLMSRLQLRPPYLDTNSFLSHSLDDFLLTDDDDDDDDEDDKDDDAGELASPHSVAEGRLLAEEEAKLEKEIIRTVLSGDAQQSLKPNSSQSVDVGGHSVCVGFHEEPGSGYRVWEWHGHVVLFDEENGYSAEYIYGNYFERLQEKKKGAKGYEEDKSAGDSGLRDLIGDSKVPVSGGGGRILHRNSLNAGSAQ